MVFYLLQKKKMCAKMQRRVLVSVQRGVRVMDVCREIEHYCFSYLGNKHTLREVNKLVVYRRCEIDQKYSSIVSNPVRN